MDAISDTFAKHGVLASETKPSRDSAGRFTPKPAEPAELTVWKDVRVGDTIRVQGSTWVDDGVHEVIQIDGPRDHEHIKVTDLKRGTWWVGKKHVIEIVSTKATPAEPVWKSLKVGDRIEITALEGSPGSFWMNKQAGVFEVAEIDRDYNVVRDLRILTRALSNGHQLGWVSTDRLVRKVDGEAKATSPGSLLKPATTVQVPVPEMAWKRAKVGDTIRVSQGVDHRAGDFVVTKVRDFETSSRLAVDYQGRNGKVWWIQNDKVEMVVTDKPTGAVRGNFLIHVDVPTIMANRSAAKHDPVIVARRLSEVSKVELFRELAWDGPSRFVHHHFQRIEGTDIQNWVETDAPLTCWRDGGGITMQDPRQGDQRYDQPKPMTKPILGAFVIHIAAPVLMRNRKEGRNDPVIAVRKAFTNWATDIVFARRVEWNGPSRMVHRPSTPIPGTEGRGVSFIETDADVTVYLDDQEPMILRMPPLQAAA